MRRILLALLLFGLPLTVGPGCLDDERPAPAGGAPEAAPTATRLTAPAFSLTTRPDDAPGLVRKKAALRLFKGYSVTVALLTGCQARGPEAGPALEGFNSRNGNTLALVMGVIKKLGGITPDIRAALDAEIGAATAAGVPDCQDLIKTVAQGGRDIYKAPEYLDDYRLIRSGP